MTRKITSILGALAALLLLAPAAFAQSIIPAGGGSSSGGSGPFTQSCGTVIATQPCLDLTATWATTGTYVGAIRLNVTDSGPANTNSLIFDLQVGGASKLNVDKNGRLTSVSEIKGTDLWVNSNSLTTGGIFWGTSADVFLGRDAANTLAQRNGTSAQCFKLANTYTDASNNEYGQLCWSSNVLSLSATAAGTGTLRAIVIAAPVATAGLPTCNSGSKGARSFVTDATSSTFAAAPTGGGAVNMPVFCNGAAWLIG